MPLCVGVLLIRVRLPEVLKGTPQKCRIGNCSGPFLTSCKVLRGLGGTHKALSVKGPFASILGVARVPDRLMGCRV